MVCHADDFRMPNFSAAEKGYLVKDNALTGAEIRQSGRQIEYLQSSLCCALHTRP